MTSEYLLHSNDTYQTDSKLSESSLNAAVSDELGEYLLVFCTASNNASLSGYNMLPAKLTFDWRERESERRLGRDGRLGFICKQ